MRIEQGLKLDYSNVLLRPKRSTLGSRKDVGLTRSYTFRNYVPTEIVHNVAKGTFYQWMKKRGKLGGQNKVPRLANNREYIDAILEMLNRKSA